MRCPAASVSCRLIRQFFSSPLTVTASSTLQSVLGSGSGRTRKNQALNTNTETHTQEQPPQVLIFPSPSPLSSGVPESPVGVGVRIAPGPPKSRPTHGSGCCPPNEKANQGRKRLLPSKQKSCQGKKRLLPSKRKSCQKLYAHVENNGSKAQQKI